MTKLTPQELDERIDRIYDTGLTMPEEVKQLIHDCIEAVTPDQDAADFDTPDAYTGYEVAIDTIQSNTKELLGNTNTEGNK